MRIRTLSLSFAALCLAGTWALAEPRMVIAPPDEKAIERLEILLDLDAYQKAEVQRVLQEQHEQMMELFAQTRQAQERPTIEQMQAHREQAHKETLAKLQQVLTEDQLKKFEVATVHRGPGVRLRRSE